MKSILIFSAAAIFIVLCTTLLPADAKTFQSQPRAPFQGQPVGSQARRNEQLVLQKQSVSAPSQVVHAEAVNIASNPLALHYNVKMQPWRGRVGRERLQRVLDKFRRRRKPRGAPPRNVPAKPSNSASNPSTLCDKVKMLLLRSRIVRKIKPGYRRLVNKLFRRSKPKMIPPQTVPAKTAKVKMQSWASRIARKIKAGFRRMANKFHHHKKPKVQQHGL